MVKTGTSKADPDGPGKKKPDPSKLPDGKGKGKLLVDQETRKSEGSSEGSRGSESESGAGGKKRNSSGSSEGSDDSDSDDSAMPEADNPNGMNGMGNGGPGIIPGNWGSNCPIMIPLCNNELTEQLCRELANLAVKLSHV
uniref:Uncharacterized protein n=1 Tax=Ditylenchus dipsaci TaxID=166011 RepID=A0A915ECP4_9BILA